jgi:hypothetical protein
MLLTVQFIYMYYTLYRVHKHRMCLFSLCSLQLSLHTEKKRYLILERYVDVVIPFYQKCAVLYICIRHGQLIPPPPPPPSPPPLLPHPQLYLANERMRKLCVDIYSLVYSLVRLKTMTMPFVLNDVWSMPP